MNNVTLSSLYTALTGSPVDGEKGTTGNSTGLPPSIVETVAGLTAGSVSTLALHPLDIVKVRLQVDHLRASHLGNTFHVARDIFLNEGRIAGFYRGLTPNLIGNSISWGLYFFWYDRIKDGLHSIHGESVAAAQGGLGSMDFFLASGISGVLTSSLTNPIWVIKTRMLMTGANAPGAYASFISGVRSIYRQDGILGFYRGFIPALFGVSHGALQFMAYERLKQFRSRMSRIPIPSHESSATTTATATTSTTITTTTRILDNADYLLSSTLSKIFAGCITYPYQLLRSRLQAYNADKMYRDLIDAVVQIWQKEHIRGFYKGLVPNLVRVLPSTCVTFLVYENTKSYLSKPVRGV
ncbi:hypothetical protein KEM54_003364 [Ascosphaera aggregata]|nr:hypothetical protein KEM54_003364 [Ascosphaera aggregata]